MAECKKSVSVTYFNIQDPEGGKAWDEAGAGAMYADEDAAAGRDGFIYLKVPSNNERGWKNGGALRVYREEKPEGSRFPAWKIQGDVTKPETVTLTPSIHLVGTWHGYLKQGNLQSC
jgi:hypothetical protein